jgi:hypothetical protein
MPVTVTLEDDEALVLFELLASQTLQGSVPAAERNAMDALEALLQKQLVAPFLPEYAQLLEEARQSLVRRYGE